MTGNHVKNNSASKIPPKKKKKQTIFGWLSKRRTKEIETSDQYYVTGNSANIVAHCVIKRPTEGCTYLLAQVILMPSIV